MNILFNPYKFILVRGRSFFPCILLNEIQTTFSQLAILPADLCTDRAHYSKNQRSTALGRNKNMAVEGGTVSHYYILVIRKFIFVMWQGGMILFFNY